MNPRLIAISGPLGGKVFTLDEPETCIGRDATNKVAIRDSSVSRRHCLIKRAAEHFTLVDLGSYNGTQVNDLYVKEHALAHGDQILIADSLFIFRLDENENSERNLSDVYLDEAHVNTGEIVRLRAEEAFRQMARDLHVLMRIATRINALRGLEEVQREFLELLFEIVPAERGAILLARENSADEYESTFGLNRFQLSSEQTAGDLAATKQPVRVSSTIARQVLREGVALLSNEVATSEFGATESLIAARARSLLCVPLHLFNRTRGVIYLETSHASARFDEDHLRLLTAIAGIAAVALENARHIEQLESENQTLRAEARIEREMIGESRQMRAVYDTIARAAPTDVTVLIMGESGTGKELAARAVHRNSSRAAKPFVAINCAALTETLLESELFGHEKGAFTGAVAQKKGKLEAANGSTVFLDEIGELAPALQVKLLRALQEREFERVGGTRTVSIDVRVIAATNRNLEEAIRAGRFRSDLYYRLNVVSFAMPPLRERREDIPLLANYFIEKHSRRCKRRVTNLSAEAQTCLMNHGWTGNVRELENAIEHAIVLGSSDTILPEDLPEAILETEPSGAATNESASYHDAIRAAKRELILNAVARAGSNYTEAARLLGVHPNYLHRLIRNMNLKTELQSQSLPQTSH